MKKRLILLGFVLMTMAGSVQGQGFLKKVNGALDKMNKGLEKVANPSDSKKTSAKTSVTKTSTTKDGESSADNDSNDGFYKYPNVKRSALFGITQKTFEESDRKKAAAKYAQFKTTASTKVVKVEQLSGYMRLGFFSDNRAFVVLDKEAFCVDDKGNVVKRWGSQVGNYFDYTRMLPHFDSGRVLLKDGESGSVYKDLIIYDKDFKAIKKIPSVVEYTYYQDGTAFVHYQDKSVPKRGILYDTKEKFAFYDVNGNQVMSALSSPLDASMGNRYFSGDMAVMRPVSEGLVAFVAPKTQRGSGDAWGFRDKSGKVVIPAKYDLVQDFSCGLAAVATSESGTRKWGFIDKTGRMVIEPKFSAMPSKFDACGQALVMDKEKNLMFIDKSGQIVSKKFKSVTPFYNGKAFCYVESSREDGKHYGAYTALIDDKYNEIALITTDDLNLVYGSETIGYMNCYFNPSMSTGGSANGTSIYGGVGNFAEGRIYLNVHGLGLCLLSESGELMMADLGGPFVNGLAPVVQSRGMSLPAEVGYVNMQGEWVIKFEENEF